MTLLLAWAVAQPSESLGVADHRRAEYTVDLTILYGLMTFRLTGTLEEAVDFESGVYRFALAGQGAGIDNRLWSAGILRDGRWAPVLTRSIVHIAGRESRVEINYDYDEGLARYRYSAETFLLRRIRRADDRVALPASAAVDDVVTATLNYADARWARDRGGALRTLVVRRRRSEDEGPDDVQAQYGAELVPLVLRVQEAGETGRITAAVDLTRFSGWARRDRPARVVFGANRRPEEISASLILGTSVSVRLHGGA